MLNKQMQALIRTFSAGAVATINPDGTPAVSPKATFAVLDDTTLIFGNIRSFNTVRNIQNNPAVEICFTDILARRAVRVRGRAVNIAREEAGDTLKAAYAELWGPYEPHVRSYVKIDITAAQMVTSPAYDVGFTEDELRQTNLAKLNAL